VIGTRVGLKCGLVGGLLWWTIALVPAWAGGPKFVAGSSFFNATVEGEPVHWANGQVKYFVDRGPLNGSITNSQATAMVVAAAALWNAVATAGVSLTDAGQLNEDVSAANVVAGNGVFAQPADVAPTATGYPLSIVFDSDGSVIDTLFGAGSSDPTGCQNTGVWTWLDNIRTDATSAHAVILVNGLCATSAALVQMMNFELERAFGRVLGLDYAQVNPEALTNGEAGGTQGWPVMQPMSGACGATGGMCIPQPNMLRYDDIAALNRIYPITAANVGSFPGKMLTAENTISIHGTLKFASGIGMQGVNVVARPLDQNGNPLYQYTVTAVSGRYFSGNHGSAVTGWTNSNGDALSEWGSNDASLQGYFDLSDMPLPPGATSANYQVSFEAINPLYMLAQTVGPYDEGSPAPSGTMPVLSVAGMTAGTVRELDVTIADSAAGGSQDALGTESAPRPLPASGMWCGRLSAIEQTDWLVFPVRAGRAFTVVTQALNEAGTPSEVKALPALGVWDAFDAVGSAAVGFAPALNGNATGETWLRVGTAADDVVRLGIADMRGDGRPDYAYKGWVLYADSVLPARLPAAGGPIVIRGMGFRPSDTVLVGGQAAVVTSVSANEITAIAPVAKAGVTGSVDVEVDDLPVFYAAAVISGGVSYDAGTGDSLTLVTAPANTVPAGVPLPFSIAALGPDLKAAGGVTVTYAVTSGTAQLGCGSTSCAVAASGDGMATMMVTAMNGSAAVVTASLSNGANLQAHFTGGPAPTIGAMASTLSIAAGATVNWTTQALVLNNGSPASGQSVTWQTTGGIRTQDAAAVTTNASGVASKTLTVGPLAEGQQVVAIACVNGTSQCVNFTVLGARPEYGWLEAVSGTAQSLGASGTPAQVVLRLRDMNGNPMAGGLVTLYEALYAWAPACPAHGRCAQPEMLGTQVANATSAIDGLVVFAPVSLIGTLTQMVGEAATGATSTLSVTIEQHP
jgi:hypothetical protein